MSGNDYSIGDLLVEFDGELELVTGNRDAAHRAVLGAHSIELENPAKWLEPGWMMMTMGVRLRNKPEVQRQLVRELKDIGASCLGFGVGLVFKHVPPVLVEEANRLDLPVVRVSEEAQFGEIARAVFHSTVGLDATTFRRLSSIQQNLVRAFADEDPLESMVRRLGRLTNAVVAVIQEDGPVLAANGVLPQDEMLAALALERPTQSLHVGGWSLLASKLDEGGGIANPKARWLVLASEYRVVEDELSRAALQVTVPLMSAQLRMRTNDREQDRALRRSVLEALLDEHTDVLDRKLLGAKVAALGLDSAEGVSIGVVRCTPGTADHLAMADVALSMCEAFERGQTPYLLTQRDGIICVASDGRSLREVSTELVGTDPSLRVGIGRDVTDLNDCGVSLRDAHLAVQRLALQTQERLLAFDDLDLVTQILAEVSVDRLGPKVSVMSKLLRDQPIQFEALRAYFAHNRDVKAAAAAIYLHPNTLRYRLERFETAMGRSLQDPSVIASIYCLLTLMPEETDPPGRDDRQLG